MALRAGFLLQVCMALCRVTLCHAQEKDDDQMKLKQMGYTKGPCPSDQFSEGSWHGYSKCKPCSNAQCPEGQKRKGSCPGTASFGRRVVVDGYYCEGSTKFNCEPPNYYDASKNRYGCQTCPDLTCAEGEYLRGMCGQTRNDAKCTCSVRLLSHAPS